MITANNPLIDQKNRIYYVDLLRALAIMLVFSAHTITSFQASEFWNAFRYGGTGVDLFFLLSGWLIGSQLFSEQSKFGNIELRRFWFRRWMRTFPAYFAVLIFTLCQLYLTKDRVANPLPYFIFIQNYYPMEYFTVSWSLAVEEQFYLVIAPIILLVSKLKSVKIQSVVLITILFAPLLLRYFGLYTSLDETHVRLDCCMMGVYLAFVHKRQKFWWKILEKNALLLCALAVASYVAFFCFRWFPPFEGYSDPSKLVLAFVFGGMLIKAVTTPVSRLPYLHVVIMHISTRSYSIYLIHPDALAICKRLIADQPLGVYYIVALITSLLAAEVLYRIVEIPFIKLRDKYTATTKRTLA